jgi:hypothetical protein
MSLEEEDDKSIEENHKKCKKYKKKLNGNSKIGKKRLNVKTDD